MSKPLGFLPPFLLIFSNLSDHLLVSSLGFLLFSLLDSVLHLLVNFLLDLGNLPVNPFDLLFVIFGVIKFEISVQLCILFLVVPQRFLHILVLFDGQLTSISVVVSGRIILFSLLLLFRILENQRLFVRSNQALVPLKHVKVWHDLMIFLQLAKQRWRCVQRVHIFNFIKS